MMLKLSCEAKYENVMSSGPRNPETKPDTSDLVSLNLEPARSSPRNPKPSPKQSPAPFDCSKTNVSAQDNPAEKAHALRCSSEKRTMQYSAISASRVLYQLCNTRKRYATPA